jgi:hypothetical protein
MPNPRTVRPMRAREFQIVCEQKSTFFGKVVAIYRSLQNPTPRYELGRFGTGLASAARDAVACCIGRKCPLWVLAV